jgi:hypothetical protein
MDTDINLLFDGLLPDAFDRMPVSQRVRYAYAANVGLRPPDEDAIAAMVRSSTPDERLGLAMIFGPRPDLIASVLEYPDLRTGMWRLVQYMVPDPPPALEWILSPHGSPPPGVADHRVVAMANPVGLAMFDASSSARCIRSFCLRSGIIQMILQTSFEPSACKRKAWCQI